MIDRPAVEKKYEELCAQKSDINQLLPFLRAYAEKSNHITEMGVREPTSTYAFLAGGPEKLISYDIKKDPKIGEVEALAPGIFTFKLENVLGAVIEETDFLFIDTFHTGEQLRAELAAHAANAKKYIGLHDTSTFWESDESPYPGMPASVAGKQGLKQAVLPFLRRGDWRLAFMTEINNGLIIMELKKPGGLFSAQTRRHWGYLLLLRSVKLRRILHRVIG